MSCTYGGQAYSEGSVICMNGKEARCGGGRWSETGYDCGSERGAAERMPIIDGEADASSVAVWRGSIWRSLSGPGDATGSSKCGLNGNGQAIEIINSAYPPVERHYIVEELWEINDFRGWSRFTLQPGERRGLGCNVHDTGYGGNRYRHFRYLSTTPKYLVPLPSNGVGLKPSDLAIIILDPGSGAWILNRDLESRLLAHTRSNTGLDQWHELDPFGFGFVASDASISAFEILSINWR